MFKEKENKWTRPRSYWALHGGDVLMLAVSLLCLGLTIGGVAMILLHPRIPGISDLFAAPPPPSPAEQKLHLAPGETEVILFKNPARKPAQPPEPRK